MPPFQINVNGSTHEVEVDAQIPLLWVLRDHLGLMGTKFGCGRGFCGACMVHVDGEAVPACVLPVQAVGDAAVVTIEGLSEEGTHPVQRAWVEERVPQCGYCQAGQVMSAAALLTRTPRPTAEEVHRALEGNLCRCGTYLRIRRAVRRASELLAGEER